MAAPKRPESVLVVVYTADLYVLLLRRREPSDFWQSVTGSMEWQESDPLETAHRELFEETGLVSPDLERCEAEFTFAIAPEWRQRYAADVTDNHEYVFRLQLSGRLPVVLNPDEHDDYQWLPRGEALARAWSWTNREAIERFVI